MLEVGPSEVDAGPKNPPATMLIDLSKASAQVQFFVVWDWRCIASSHSYCCAGQISNVRIREESYSKALRWRHREHTHTHTAMFPCSTFSVALLRSAMQDAVWQSLVITRKCESRYVLMTRTHFTGRRSRTRI